MKTVCLAWATKKRHIAVDGKILCNTEHKTDGYSVKNGQYNTLSLSGLPTYKKHVSDTTFTHGDGIIDFKPISEQEMKIDTKSICTKCLHKYEKNFNQPQK
jgi:hypothetical protein